MKIAKIGRGIIFATETAPEKNGGGSALFAPAVSARPTDVIKSDTITSEVFQDHGFDYVGEFLMGIRHTEHVCDLLHDRSNPKEMQRAQTLLQFMVCTE